MERRQWKEVVLPLARLIFTEAKSLLDLTFSSGGLPVTSFFNSGLRLSRMYFFFILSSTNNISRGYTSGKLQCDLLPVAPTPNSRWSFREREFLELSRNW